MRYLLAFTAVIWGQCSAAQELPELFALTGLADGDVMHLRAAPDPAARLIGSLTPYTKQVEVIERGGDGGKWALVSTGSEQWGWLYFDDYLVPVPTPEDIKTDFDRPLWCSGSEPFWTLIVDPITGVTWDSHGADAVRLDMVYAGRAANGRSNQMMTAASSNFELTVALQQQQCWDGMGEGLFGFKAQILENRANIYSFQSGCCSLLNPG